jgi:hypothetical protein
VLPGTVVLLTHHEEDEADVGVRDKDGLEGQSVASTTAILEDPSPDSAWIEKREVNDLEEDGGSSGVPLQPLGSTKRKGPSRMRMWWTIFVTVLPLFEAVCCIYRFCMCIDIIVR